MVSGYITDDTRPPVVADVAKTYGMSGSKLAFVKTKHGQETYLFFPHRAWFYCIDMDIVQFCISVFSRWRYYDFPFPSSPVLMIENLSHTEGYSRWNDAELSIKQHKIATE